MPLPRPETDPVPPAVPTRSLLRFFDGPDLNNDGTERRRGSSGAADPVIAFVLATIVRFSRPEPRKPGSGALPAAVHRSRPGPRPSPEIPRSLRENASTGSPRPPPDRPAAALFAPPGLPRPRLAIDVRLSATGSQSRSSGTRFGERCRFRARRQVPPRRPSPPVHCCRFSTGHRRSKNCSNEKGEGLSAAAGRAGGAGREPRALRTCLPDRDASGQVESQCTLCGQTFRSSVSRGQVGRYARSDAGMRDRGDQPRVPTPPSLRCSRFSPNPDARTRGWRSTPSCRTSTANPPLRRPGLAKSAGSAPGPRPRPPAPAPAPGPGPGPRPPSPVHAGPAPVHAGTRPRRPGTHPSTSAPAPVNAAPAPVHAGPAPVQGGPTPIHRVPVPPAPAPAQTDRSVC